MNDRSKVIVYYTKNSVVLNKGKLYNLSYKDIRLIHSISKLVFSCPFQQLWTGLKNKTDRLKPYQAI